MENESRQSEQPEQAGRPDINKNRKLICMLSGILIVLVIGAAVIGIRNNRASASDDGDDTKASETEDSSQEKWQEGTVSYNGKSYKYNSSIKSYLFMGIDKDEPVSEAKDSVSGGQSDAMFLVVLDSEKKSISVISIHRNTMTKIEVCDENGLNKQEIQAQICLQHGYGDGKHYSCARAEDAVSYLLYNLPISGYLAMNMGGIPKLNDAVGGIEVTVLQDLALPDRGVELHAGEIKNLNGDEAYCYLRKRDTEEYDSASDRLRRQEQYIEAFMSKAKTVINGDTEKAAEIYDSISEYLVTDVDFVTFISDIVAYEYDENGMYTVPGETVMGEEYEEYYVDDDALYDLIIQMFYEEAK